MSGTTLAPPRPAPAGIAGLSGLDRVRLLAGVAMGTVLVSYGLLVAVAALLVLSTGAPTSADELFGTAVPLWLAAHQVPLVLDGAPLTVLPLLPTVGVAVLVAAGAKFAARRLAGAAAADVRGTHRPETGDSPARDGGLAGSKWGTRGWRDAARPVIATFAGTHAAVAVLASALLQPAGPVTAEAPWAAALAAGLTSGVAAAYGVLRALGAPPFWWAAPQWLRAGAWAGRVGLAGMASCGAVLLAVTLLTSVADVHELVARAGAQSGAGLGMTLLSVGYLPNAVIAATSWALGPGVQLGTALTSPLGAAGGPLLPLPLLAAVPTTAPPPWAATVLLLPILTGLLVGRCCRTAGESVPARLKAVGVAALGVAAVCGLLALLAGGRLAAGPFDPVQVPAAAMAGASLLLVGLPAAAVAAPDTPARPEPEPDPDRPARRRRFGMRRFGLRRFGLRRFGLRRFGLRRFGLRRIARARRLG